MVRFWQNWLMAVGALCAVMGLVLGVFSLTAITAFTGLFDPIFWPDAGPDAGTVRFQRYVIGGAGGMTAAWGILIFAIARSALSRPELPILNALTASVIAWFVIDSAAKIAAGAAFFVAGNVPLLVLLLIPLIRVRGAVGGGAQVQSRMTLPERPERMASKPSA